MQGDSTPRRSEGRFFIDGQATRVTITTVEGPEEALPLRGRLADLSLHGVKIAINGKIASGTKVNLHIEIPSIRMVLDQPAIVRWQQPRDAVSWWTGCELVEPFQAPLIDQLANAQVLNRRRDPRYPVGKVARARWELSDEILTVELVNFSKGGFCVIFPGQPEIVRERLLLLLDVNDHEVTVPARVMWSGPVGERFAVGCAFGTLEGFVEVRSFAELNDGQKKRRWFGRAGQTASSQLSKWVPITLLVLAVMQGGYLVQRYPELVERGYTAWMNWSKSDAATTQPVSVPSVEGELKTEAEVEADELETQDAEPASDAMEPSPV